MVISGGKLEVGICEDVHYKTDGNLGILTNIMTTFDAARCRCWLETLVEKFDVWVFECDVGLADEG